MIMGETIYVCGGCGKPVKMTIVERWPNGEIAEATWDCDTDGCGKPAHAWYCDGGTLDLGLVRDEPLPRSDDFWIYEPDR